MLITAVSTNDLTVVRARAGTSAAAHADSTAVTQVNVAYASATSLSVAITDVAATTISVARTADIAVYDYIKIGTEVLFVTDIDTTNNVLTVVRGVLSTSAATALINVAVLKQTMTNVATNWAATTIGADITNSATDP